MSTITSGLTSWLTPDEFFKRNDVRTVADVAQDAGARPYKKADGTIDTTLLAADVNFLAALAAASGQFEADVFTGERYTRDDLTLISTTTCNAQAYLFSLVSRIARMNVLDRRLNMDPAAEMPAWYKDTLEQLKRIRQGDAVFGLLEVQEAGLPKADYMSPADWAAVQTTVTQAAPFFGRRNKDFRRPGKLGGW